MENGSYHVVILMIVLIVVNDTLGNPLIHHSFLFRKRQKGRSPDQLTDLAAKLQVDPFDGDRGIQELAPQTAQAAAITGSYHDDSDKDDDVLLDDLGEN